MALNLDALPLDDAIKLAQYLHFSIAARECRLKGKVARALVEERHADKAFKALPEYLRW